MDPDKSDAGLKEWTLESPNDSPALRSFSSLLPHGRSPSPESLKEHLPFELLPLEYPQGGFELFPLILPSKATDDQSYNPIHDLYSTAQFLVQDTLSPDEAKPFGNAKQGLLRGIIKSCRKRLAPDLADHVHRFNDLMLRIRKDRQNLLTQSSSTTLTSNGGEGKRKEKPASTALVCHVLEQAYARVVAPEAHTLRQYEGKSFSFSQKTHGIWRAFTTLFFQESSFSMIS